MPYIRDIGHRALTLAQDIGLVIVAIATICAIGLEVSVMVSAKKVTLADLLLMFIYLEVLAMVAIYLESGKLPVRMPLYIAIVALARYMILDMKNLDTTRLLGIAASTLIFAITVFIIRYGHIKFPYEKKESDT